MKYTMSYYEILPRKAKPLILVFVYHIMLVDVPEGILPKLQQRHANICKSTMQQIEAKLLSRQNDSR